MSIIAQWSLNTLKHVLGAAKYFKQFLQNSFSEPKEVKYIKTFFFQELEALCDRNLNICSQN